MLQGLIWVESYVEYFISIQFSMVDCIYEFADFFLLLVAFVSFRLLSLYRHVHKLYMNFLIHSLHVLNIYKLQAYK